MNSNETIELLKKRDLKAVEKLYDQYAPAIYGIILRIVKSTAEAEMLLEQTFLKTLDDIHSYNKHVTLFTWMCGIARSSARSRSMSVARETELANSDSSIPENFKVLLATLDSPCKEVITHVLFRGYSLTEASAALNIPLAKFKEQFRCGLRHIYNDMGKDLKILLATIILVLPLYF